MPLSKEDVLINKIQSIREDNNRLWMNIVRTAMENNPIITKRILREIRTNDLLVSQKMEELTRE